MHNYNYFNQINLKFPSINAFKIFNNLKITFL